MISLVLFGAGVVVGIVIAFTMFGMMAAAVEHDEAVERQLERRPPPTWWPSGVRKF